MTSMETNPQKISIRQFPDLSSDSRNPRRRLLAEEGSACGIATYAVRSANR